MVLPTPAADDPLRPETGWIEAIQRTLRLSTGGVLVHVDRAVPQRLGELARALLAEWPDLDVLEGAAGLETVPEGATRVLVPHVEETFWLNLNRPIVSRRNLRIVLWCDHETTVELSRKAPDFFDWISAHVECPAGPVPFALAGLRAAIRVKAPGIHWTGDVDDTARHRVSTLVEACVPGALLRWIDVEGPYEEVVRRVESIGGEGTWLGAVADVQWKVWRFRWACAEAKSACREIVAAPGLECPGFWPVHDRMMTFAQVRERLASTGAVRGLLLAALLHFEPEAVELSAELLRVSVPEERIRSVGTDATDPGAALAAWASTGGHLPVANPRSVLAARATGRPPADAHGGVDVEEGLRHDLAIPSWISRSLVAGELGDDGASFAWALRELAAQPETAGDALAIKRELAEGRLEAASERMGSSLKRLLRIETRWKDDLLPQEHRLLQEGVALVRENHELRRVVASQLAELLVLNLRLDGVGHLSFVRTVIEFADLLSSSGAQQTATRLLLKVLGTNEPGDLDLPLLAADEVTKLRPILERFLAGPSPEITPETAVLAREALLKALRAQGRFEEAALLTSDLPPDPGGARPPNRS